LERKEKRKTEIPKEKTIKGTTTTLAQKQQEHGKHASKRRQKKNNVGTTVKRGGKKDATRMRKNTRAKSKPSGGVSKL